MPISLENSSNIRVTYNTGSNYVIETVKSDMYVRGTTSGNLSSEPTVSPSIRSDIVVESFTYTGTANTKDYTKVFSQDTICDILIVGGGGGGGGSIGGGGGGGSVIYSTNITIPAGSYNISVGKGGTKGLDQTNSTSGFNTTAFGATAVGGGRGGDYNISNDEQSGGSGGGKGGGDNIGLDKINPGVANLKGSNTIPNTSLLFTNYQYYVNNGGLSLWQTHPNGLVTRGGGGGGAGSAGGSGGGNGIDTATLGVGGDGIPITISGTSVYYGAGGGGGAHRGYAANFSGKSGGLGGGGNGGNEVGGDPANFTNGTDGTGYGAGGGGGALSKNGGNGGSGIVIIRYRDLAAAPTSVNMVKTLNFNYYSSLSPTIYTLTFNTRTLATINNGSDKLLNGSYTITLGNTLSTIVPTTANQNLQDTKYSSSTISVSYHLLNPILDPIGAQWTYSSSNTNVYHLGSVGIGTTSPEYSLDVRGNIFTSVGGYTQTGTENWIIQSDRRIKENIVKASYEKCLENIKKIELYNFNFKENYVKTNDRNQLGFIAQEVREVYPKAINVITNDGRIEDLLTLNTTQIKYTLYGAVKSLIEKVENLEMRVDKLYKIAIPDVDIIEIFESTSNISIITSNISTSNMNTIGSSKIDVITST